DGLAGELVVELRLLNNQPFADGNGFGSHRREQRLQSAELLARQTERLGQLDCMSWSRIPVQLGRKGEAHSAPLLEIGDLLYGELFDRASGSPGMGLLLILRERRATEQGERDHRAEDLHRLAPPLSSAHDKEAAARRR